MDQFTSRIQRTKSPLRLAFTLIEVLVVVAIISLLAAILIPSLSRAREQSKRAVCSSQLHQLGIAFTMYAHDHRDLLPIKGWAGYSIKSYHPLFDTGVANLPGHRPGVIRDNTGPLFGKYMGKELRTFYCPSARIYNDNYSYEDPELGGKAFLDPSKDFAESSYSYAAPLWMDNSPRNVAKNPYPDEDLGAGYRNWKSMEEAHRQAPIRYSLHALLSDDYIDTPMGPGLGFWTHETGYNVLYTDFHVSWVRDGNQYLARARIKSHSLESAIAWDMLTRGNVSFIRPQE